MKIDRLWKRLAMCILIAGIAATHTWADGYRNPPESASALGRGGGRIADTSDASAVTVNPANMADMDRPSVMTSIMIGYAERQFTGPTGIREKTKDPWAYLPSAYGVMPIAGGDHVLGVGITIPFGRATQWDEDASFTLAGAPYYANLYVVNVNPGIATRLTDNLAVGLGMSLYVSSVQMKQFFPMEGEMVNANFEGDGTSYGYNAGLSWDVAKGHRLALVYRSPFDIDYDGDFTVPGAPMGSDLESEIKFPTIISAGYSFPLLMSVRVELNVEWVEHSRNMSLPITIGDLPTMELPQDWDDNWTYGIGIAWQCSDAWVIRGGYTYLETPSPTRTMVPIGAEESNSVLMIGCGFKRGVHTFDFAYAGGIYDGRTVTDNVNPAVNGKYDILSQLAALAYSYTF
jgi:long-chain fatty acid transport protein